MTVLRLERVRADYERANRPAVWLLLGLAMLVLFARHITPWILVGRPDDVLLTGGDVLAAMPVLLAAAAVMAVPDRRPIVVGALLLAAAAALESARHLSPLYGGDLAFSSSAALGTVTALLLVGGPLLIGHGLGGVHTRPGVALVIVGLVISVVAAIYAVELLYGAMPDAPIRLELFSEGGLLVVGSVFGQFMYVAWAYLLAAALKRRARFLALGSGLLLAVNLIFVILDGILRAQEPGTVASLTGDVFLLVSLVAWAALIAGMLVEAGEAAAEISRR